MFKRIPGTRDFLPEDVYSWQEIERISREIFSVYNYKEIRSPLIEDAFLFTRSLGESTELVQKQMFLISGRGEDSYALRPEGTASIVRSYIENNLDRTAKFAKFYYIGPMFRRERPQKGRLRQFHHIGCEAIGSGSANLDIEVISLADSLLRGFSVEGYIIRLNSLGCPKDKKALAETLRKKLKGRISQTCEDCRRRFDTNVLRVLDCKRKECKEITAGLDIGDSYLCAFCREHFRRVKDGLDSLGVKYEDAPRLVRGLDYYTRTVFEITHKDLGAQDAIGAGGRYDNLVKELGGPDLGAMGFAFGVERVLLVRSAKAKPQEKNLVYLITLGEKAAAAGASLLGQLRESGIASETDYEARSIKGAMRLANDLGARFVLILGDDELKKQVVALKDMQSGKQEEVALDTIIGKLRDIIRD